MKGLEEFHKRSSRPDGLRGQCKACDGVSSAAWQKANPEKVRALKLKRYGITVEQYEAMLKAQGGVCKICCKSCKTGRRLAVDHSHTTRVVRALLCGRCNTDLGVYENHKIEFEAYLNDTAH